MSRVLIVEDDLTMAALLSAGLTDDGHETTVVHSGSAAVMAAQAGSFDLIATDVMLPDIDGFEVCRLLRAWGVTAPIIVLTARDSVDDRVRGLDFGADDYIVKPFAFVEFAARVRAQLRRITVLQGPALQFGGVALDPATGAVAASGRALALSRREIGVLRALLQRGTDVTARETILDEVWGTVFVDPSIVDQYIRYLRRKLSAVHADIGIETVRGVGYRLTSDGS